MIDHYDELIQVSDLIQLYISRRSLKHFVERRKTEMCVHKDKDDILDRLYFAVEHLEDVVIVYDKLEINNNSYIYSKHFNARYKANIRIVIESVSNHFEIKSIHFHKNKHTTN